MSAEVILHNAKIATNGVPSFVEAIAISDGKVIAIGRNEEILHLLGPATRVIDVGRRTVIPGLNDSHMHPIRGGLNYNLELRCDGVPSLADALRMLKEQAARLGGAHSARPAEEELGAELLLEPLHLIGERWLGDVEPSGGALEPRLLDDHFEAVEAIEGG